MDEDGDVETEGIEESLPEGGLTIGSFRAEEIDATKGRKHLR